MPTLRVRVTQEHLDHTPRSKYIEHDLFTRALGRKGLGGVLVILIGGDEASIPKKLKPEDPDLAWDLRHRWEDGENIEPFEFDIQWGGKK